MSYTESNFCMEINVEGVKLTLNPSERTSNRSEQNFCFPKHSVFNKGENDRKWKTIPPNSGNEKQVYVEKIFTTSSYLVTRFRTTS